MARPEVTLGPLPRVRALRVGSWVEWLAEERLEQGSEGRGRGGLPRAEADQGQGVVAVHSAAGARQAAAPWAGTRRTGEGLWPQPLSGWGYAQIRYLPGRERV